MNIDLGTYHLRVKFSDGRGFIDTWHTGRRYCRGRNNAHPLNAEVIQPSWSSEDELADCMYYMYTEGNFSCDCNRLIYLADAAQDTPVEDPPCGEKLELVELTMIRPDGSERSLFPA